MSTAKPDIVTPEEWRAAREALLEKEKAHTRARDALAAERRRMPMIRSASWEGYQSGPLGALPRSTPRRTMALSRELPTRRHQK